MMTNSAPRRIRAIDATRGTAMLLVFLSHFAQIFFSAKSQSTMNVLLRTIGMVATPTFVIISGAMLAFLFRSQSGRFARTQRKLLDRGLFFILIGHPVVAGAYWAKSASFVDALSDVFITDVIGVCIILGPWVVRHFDRKMRAVLAISLYAGSSCVAYAWHPTLAAAKELKGVFVGEPFDAVFSPTFSFSLIPWFAIYVVGSLLGDFIVEAGLSDRPAQVFKRLRLLSAILLGVGAVASVALKTGHRFLMMRPGGAHLALFLHFHQKSPPGVVYLSIFGGAGLGLLSLWGQFDDVQLDGAVAQVLVRLGQNSFFAFVAQFYVYYTFLFWIRPTHSALWPVWFASSVGCVLLMVHVWRHFSGNRLLTLGLAPGAPASPRAAPTLGSPLEHQPANQNRTRPPERF